MPDKTTLGWFHFSSPWFSVGKFLVRPWNFFNRYKLEMAVTQHEWYCGIGLLQINGRHLMYVGRDGESGWKAYLLFIRMFGGEDV